MARSRRFVGGWRVAVFLLAAVLAAPPAGAQAPEGIRDLRAYSLQLVNEARRAAGLGALELDPVLTEAAQGHADDMLTRNYYGHASPEGDNVMDRFTAAGGSPYRVVAENIARCRNCPVPADRSSVDQLHEGWMNSPDHRKNILAEGLNRYGFGMAEASDGTRLAVETFAGPGAVPSGAIAGAQPLDTAGQTRLAAELMNADRSKHGRLPVTADRRLTTVAAEVFPPGPISNVALDRLDLEHALSNDLPWRRYRSLFGSCGGCGTDVTEADVRYFVSQWRNTAQYEDMVAAKYLTHVGMVIRADGQGRKIAIVVMAGGA